MATVQLIFGGGSFLNDISNPSLADVESTLDKLHELQIKNIDTAVIYDNSEEYLGQSHASHRFAISTKYPCGFLPNGSSKEDLLSSAEESLRKLQTDQLDVYYLHAPDRKRPIEALLKGINTLLEKKKIRRFGISNFLPAEVEELVRVAKEKGYPVPTVYQGNYSAIARHAENTLIPTLRKHNISFYAYSPIAGGFLTKDVEQLQAGGTGRWDPSSFFGGFYNALYNKPAMREGLQMWGQISKESGIAKAELAYRWVVYNSALRGEFGDSIIFGARNIGQITQTVDGVSRGPLPVEIAAQIEEVWKIVEFVAPMDNYNNEIISSDP
ncbi:Aldo/keto reductase [Aspergillus granulosus]|uniref:Aldo/keto reductase n=1 Tax=Aspergillus granulosus TaxID=176169 RepID=A0ABR4H9A9_9EURO